MNSRCLLVCQLAHQTPKSLNRVQRTSRTYSRIRPRITRRLLAPGVNRAGVHSLGQRKGDALRRLPRCHADYQSPIEEFKHNRFKRQLEQDALLERANSERDRNAPIAATSGGSAQKRPHCQLPASCDVLHDPCGAPSRHNGARQQQNPECGLGVSPCPLQAAFHGVEFAFKFLLLGHKTTRAGPEQLHAPDRAKESARTCLNKVE